MSSQGFITIHKSNNCAVTSTLRAADDCWSSVYFHYYSTLDRACSIKSSSQSHTASEQFSYSIQMCSFRSGSIFFSLQTFRELRSFQENQIFKETERGIAVFLSLLSHSTFHLFTDWNNTVAAAFISFHWAIFRVRGFSQLSLQNS